MFIWEKTSFKVYLKIQTSLIKNLSLIISFTNKFIFKFIENTNKVY